MQILGKEIKANEQEILAFAVSKGYETKKRKENIENNISELIDNSETPVEYIERIYYTPIKEDIKKFFEKEAKKPIEEKRKLEDEQIEKVVDEKVGKIIK